MKNALVRKFQPPAGIAPTGAAAAAKPDAAAQPRIESPPAADVEIPEINTNFIDNLFTDPTFVDRFDVAFGQTVHMGLDGEKRPVPPQSGSQGTDPEWHDMLDISFPKSPAK